MVMLGHQLQGLSPISICACTTLRQIVLTVQCDPDAGLGEADQAEYDSLKGDSAIETAKPLSDTAMVRSYFFGSHGLKQFSSNSKEA